LAWANASDDDTGPPGSAKTTFTFRLFPAWYFANRPVTSIIGASHIQELS
jgi:hypothetical protein